MSFTSTITPNKHVINGLNTVATGTINASGTLVITSADGVLRRQLIQIYNTGSGNGTGTVVAGVYPPAFEQSIAAATSGLQLVIPSSVYEYIYLDPAEFVQADGLSVYMTFSSGMTGTVGAFEAPIY